MSKETFDRKHCECKTFRDNVHGYISIPKEYVRLFIDTELFQRLRQIEQTGMRTLYPGARHDRFAHSLGVFHLARMAFERFWQNSKKDVENVGEEKVWQSYGILFEIAALLHDCGHAPFSHTLEFLYDREKSSPGVETDLSKRLLELNGSDDFKADFTSPDSNGKKNQGGPHERMSALLVCSEYKEAVCKLLTMTGSSFPIEDALEFITRMIIGCPYRTNLNTDKSLRNCFITLLNSSSIDVDKLDYIMRDADMSGLNTMSLDTERLLGSLTLVPVTTLTKVSLNNHDMDNAVLKGTLLAPKKEKAVLSDCEIDGELKVNLEDSGKRTGDGFMFEVKGTLNLQGRMYKMKMSPRTHTLSAEEDVEWPEETFEDYVDRSGAYFALYKPSSAQFKVLKADKIAFSDTYIHGKVTGVFTGDIVGDCRASLEKDAEAEVHYEVGYRKSSLNVIESVAYARNYEYQWVHAHHKVKYYGDYLLYELLRKCVKYLWLKTNRAVTDEDVTKEIGKIFSYKTMEGFQPYPAPWNELYWRLTDADILALFNKCYVLLKTDLNTKNHLKSDLLSLLDEYAGRAYRKSLWKSYAEMCAYLSEFTRNQIESIWRFFCETPSNPVRWPFIIEKTSGYLDDEWKVKFEQCHMRDVVWVNGKANLKELDQNKTYIYFPGDGATQGRTMTFASVSRSIGSKPESVEYANLLYLYYRPTFDADGREEKPDKSALMQLFREIATASHTP